MAIYEQLGATRVPNGDFPAKNTDASVTIPEKRFALIDTTNVMAAGVPMGVKPVATAGAIKPFFGVAIAAVVAGAMGTFQRKGVAVCQAAGTITAGDYVKISSTSGKEGKVVTASTSTVGDVVGQALTSAADGDDILVDLDKNHSAVVP
jgi:hypothetical protein